MCLDRERFQEGFTIPIHRVLTYLPTGGNRRYPRERLLRTRPAAIALWVPVGPPSRIYLRELRLPADNARRRYLHEIALDRAVIRRTPVSHLGFKVQICIPP